VDPLPGRSLDPRRPRPRRRRPGGSRRLGPGDQGRGVNDQTVKAGQPLFYVDRERYALALRQADANVAAARAALGQARRELVRNRASGELVAAESTEQSASKVEQADAALAQADAARDVASLNLARTVVTPPPTASCRT
jgi:multidrug resistance efflux pump